MTKQSGSSVRHFLVFVASVVAFVGSTLWLTADLLIDLRTEAVDFQTLGPNEVLIQTGLTRRQQAELKVGYIEKFSPPRIGIFGNHQVQYFRAAAFRNNLGLSQPQSGESDLFFNYWYADVNLPDTLDLIAYLDAIDKLPTELIVVAITTPNNDNGLHILGRTWFLPPDIKYFADKSLTTRALADNAQYMLSESAAWLGYHLDYTAVISALLNRRVGYEILDRRLCDGAAVSKKAERFKQFDLIPLPGTLLNMIAGEDIRRYCSRDYAGYLSDGAYFTNRPPHPILNKNPLNVSDSALDDGDEQRIANLLRRINALGQRSGRQVVFLIPPVYETARQGPSDLIFSRALRLVPELKIIDHRHIYREKKYFHKYDHPNHTYYEEVLTQLLSNIIEQSKR